MEDWVLHGVIWGQSAMLAVAGYMLMDGIRLVRQGNKIIGEQQELLRLQMNQLYFQQGVITAMQAGILGPWDIEPVNFRNLPVELRLRILQALVDVAVELHRKQHK